jgi:cAMP-dependent protein kinase regulator
MSSNAAGEASQTALDKAYDCFVQGDRDGALRLAVSALEGATFQLGAALLAVRVLAAENRGLVAGEAAARLVEASVRRGDLTSAVVAAHMVGACGEDAGPHFAAIAGAFGKGSKRIADVSQAPPPLPASPGVSPLLAKLKGDPLRERAESALSKWLGEDDPIAAGASLPKLPLVSALDAKPLAKMLAAFTVRDVATGAEVLRQGEEGREAFFVVRGALRVVRHGDDGSDSVLAVLGPGAIFGEMALVSESPRAAAIVAEDAATLLVAARDVLEQLAREVPVLGTELSSFCRGRMVANLLRHSAILGAVAPASREDLMNRFETRTFAAGERLVEAGAETEGLFLIASGTVRVTGTDAEGDSILLAQLGPGDVVGEISLVLRRPASADVTAAHATIALELRREQFQAAIRQHPALLGELYDLATRRDEETRSVVAQEALDASDFVLV